MQAAFEPLTHNSFPTRDELLSTVRAAAQSVGFGVSIERSTANRKVLLKCDFGGEYRDFVKAPDGEKRRKRSTRLNGCPFQLLGKCVGAIWSLRIRDLHHNHRGEALSAHTMGRRHLLSSEKREEIAGLAKQAIPPRVIEARLRREGVPATGRDVYNQIALSHRHELNGRTAMEWLREHAQWGGERGLGPSGD